MVLSEDPKHYENPQLVETDTSLDFVKTKDIPINSYIHLKDKYGIYYIVKVKEKAGNFIFVEFVYGPPQTENKRGLIRDRYLAKNHAVHFSIEELTEHALSAGDVVRRSSRTSSLNEIVITNELKNFLPRMPLVYNQSIPVFDTYELPSRNIAIEVDTISGKQYTIEVLATDENGNIHLSVQGNGSLNGTVGVLKSQIIGKGYRIQMKETNTKKTKSTSRVVDLKFIPVMEVAVEAILQIQHKQGQLGPFDH